MSTKQTEAVMPKHAIVLFDGVCNLCNQTVNFIIDHDPTGHFKFAALQDESVQPLLNRFDLSPDYLDSIVLIQNGRLHRDSAAALRIARRLTGAWPLLYAFLIVPPPIRDGVYRWIARNRYRWFGKRESCRIPTPELASRFLRPD